jgi:acyl-CoA thioester hydrolase
LNTFDFELEMQVRDYECDIQGIVNNAVYMNYLEHARHKFLQSAGLDFAKLHNEGIDPVVIRAEIDYKSSLYPGDQFSVQVKVWRKGRLRWIFDQRIVRNQDKKTMIEARISAALLRNGRPIPTDFLAEAFSKAGISFEMLQE